MLSKAFKQLKHKLRFWMDELRFSSVSSIADLNIVQEQEEMNIVFVVFDSCRYDSLVEARTPVLDSYGPIYKAWSPATYTLPSHVSFFTGIFPLVNEPIPYLNRFEKQLITMRRAGEASDKARGKHTIELGASNNDMVHALSEAGYYTVGSGAASWFNKKVLTDGFQHFNYFHAMSCEEQCNFLLGKLQSNARKKPFFAFLNLLETHTPYMHYGSDRKDYAMQARDFMEWPPKPDEEKRSTKGRQLQQAQVSAAEHLDKCMGEFLTKLPANTFVILTADHGECFGEDGYWGHGIYHPKVMEVPMMAFMLNGEDPLL